MRPTRFARGAAIVAAAALAMSACATTTNDDPTDPTDPNGTDPADPNGTDPAENPVQAGIFHQDDVGEPIQGGTLSFADYSEVRTLNPSQVIPTGASGGSALVAVYDQVMRLNVETWEYEPRIAEAVEANDDFTEWTIRIRPGITFSDGTPLDAAAVAGSMTWYVQSGGYDTAMIAPLWGGVEQVDDLTVRITLTESWATFESMLARSLGFIVAPAAIAAEEFTPIGAGAFTFGDYAPGEELVLPANPDHWDGAPYLDALRFVWLGTDETRADALGGGTVQAVYIQNIPIIEDAATADAPRFTTLTNNGRVLVINHNEGEPGSYPQVREALAHGLDPQFIADRVFDGKGYNTKSLFAEISQWYDDSIEVNEYNPELATQLLEEAKADGYDGQVTLLTPPTNPDGPLAMQAQLEAVGFEVEIDNVRNMADYISRVYAESNYSVTPSGLSLLDNDPWLQMYLAYHSRSASNVMANDDPEMDALLDELRATPLSDAQDVISRIQEHYQEAVPSVNFGHYTPTTIWADNVFGVVGTNETMTDYGKAWIQP